MLVGSSYGWRTGRTDLCSRAVLCLGLWLGASACVGGDAPSDPAGTGGSAGKSTSGASGGTSSNKAGTGGSSTSTGSGGTGGSTASAGAGGAAGAGSDAGSQPKAGSKDSHFPLSDGATWKYHHENPTKTPWDEVASAKATTYKDKPAFLFSDQEDAQGEQTTSTLVVDGTGVYRVYKEVAVGGQVAVKTAYDPAFLRYDEAWLSEGQMMTLDDDWTQTCVFTSSAAKCAPGAVKTGTTTHEYKVVSLHSQITVAAGTFDCVLIERTNPTDVETKQFWFAKGVGKVRELDTGTNATEELTEYNIP